MTEIVKSMENILGTWYVPSVHKNTTERYVKDVFMNRAKIGAVNHVDFVWNEEKNRMSMFVHFCCWFQNEFSIRFRKNVDNRVSTHNKLRHGGMKRSHSGLPSNFWVCFPSTSQGKRVETEVEVDETNDAVNLAPIYPIVTDMGDDMAKVDVEDTDVLPMVRLSQCMKDVLSMVPLSQDPNVNVRPVEEEEKKNKKKKTPISWADYSDDEEEEEEGEICETRDGSIEKPLVAMAKTDMLKGVLGLGLGPKEKPLVAWDRPLLQRQETSMF
tara:strand:+ start:3837 stop:4646 length:810 start_codon:yes stop_codon:yes gene_type:complete